MIKRIVSFSLYQPLFIVLGVALFIGGGIWAFKNLPVEAFPDVTDTQVTVISLFPGRAAEEVEKQITIPLEVGLSGLPGAVRMFSHTQFGLSFIILTFDDRYSGYFARQQVVERLREVDMPEGAQAQLAPFSTAIGEIYRYRMEGDKVSPRELRTYQDWVVSRQLRLVPGVADVVTGVVLMRRGENPSEVLKAVRAKIDQVNDTGLPAGVKVVPIYDRTWLIGKTLTTVFTNLVEGALLVSIVLWMFLGNLRAAAI